MVKHKTVRLKDKLDRLAIGTSSLLLLMTIIGAQILDPYGDALRYYELGRYTQAETRLREILDLEPECIECYDLLAQIATSQGNDSLAAVWYRQALEVEPDNASLYLKLGFAEYLAGYLLDAVGDLEHSLELNPLNAEAYYTLGMVWYDLEVLDSAKVKYTQAIALDSTIARYHFYLGDVFFMNAQLDSTLTEFQKKAQLDSALTEFQTTYRLYAKYSDAYEAAASILIQQNRWSEVIEVLELGLANASETEDTRLWLGRGYVEMGNYLRAAELLRGYVSRYPESLPAKYNYGLALYEIGEYKEAVTQLCTVTVYRPELPKAWLYLGRAYNALDQDSLAFASLDTLLAKDSTYYEAWIYRGDVDLKRDRYSRAIAQYEHASILDPNRWEAYHRQALTRYVQGEYAEAELLLYDALIREEILFNPDGADSVGQTGNTEIYDLMGDVTAAMGEDDWSVFYYSMVLELEPDNAGVRRKLIDALVRRRLWMLARQQLNWFLQLDSRNESVLYQMGRLAYAESDTAAARQYMERFQQLHSQRRQRETLELRISQDRSNYEHFTALGWYYQNLEEYSRARDYFRQAVALGDTTIPASLYMEEGEGP